MAAAQRRRDRAPERATRLSRPASSLLVATFSQIFQGRLGSSLELMVACLQYLKYSRRILLYFTGGWALCRSGQAIQVPYSLYMVLVFYRPKMWMVGRRMRFHLNQRPKILNNRERVTDKDRRS